MLRILITGVGHPIAKGLLENLRKIEENRFYIVGVDLEERGSNFNWIDKHYTVPPAKSPDFVPLVKDICRQEQIEIVIPWSDEEAEAIAQSAADFHISGVATLCGSYQSIARTVDKGTLLAELSRSAIPSPRFGLASSPEEIEDIAVKLGYPENPIVVKPRRGSCGKGLWIIDSNIDLMQFYPSQRLTLNALVSFLKEARRKGVQTPDYVAMQYLPGDDYSVDALADNGESVFIIPRRRIRAVEGISQISEVVANQEVRSMVAGIIERFNLHLNVNVQLKYSAEHGGQPLVYEVNPRISGTIVVNDAVGVRLFYYGILLALGRPLPPRESLKVRHTKMIRYWTETYLHYDDWFLP